MSEAVCSHFYRERCSMKDLVLTTSKCAQVQHGRAGNGLAPLCCSVRTSALTWDNINESEVCPKRDLSLAGEAVMNDVRLKRG